LGGSNSTFPNVTEGRNRQFTTLTLFFSLFIFKVCLRFMMKTPNIIAHTVSLDESKSECANDANEAWVEDHYSAIGGACSTTESVRLVDDSELGQRRTRKVTSRSYDCDSHARATTVSQIEKGFSVDTMRQPTYDDSDYRPRQYKPSGPFDVAHQDYYVHQKYSKVERRMSSLSMGSAKASRRERYLSTEE
jgi:hypothetical protein